MINFHKVNNNLYRGGSLSIRDVYILKRKYKINKIVSLDKEVGKKIDRATKLLGIKHIIIPLDVGNRGSLIKFLHFDIDTLLGGGNVFVGCRFGKDRTGLAITLYRSNHDGWSSKRALNEARKYGFGINVDPKIVRLYVKIIEKCCKNNNDTNNNYDGMGYDIVDNQREYPSDYQDYTLGGWEQQSWSPYEDYRVKTFPMESTDIDWPEQYETRETYGLDDSDIVSEDSAEIPQVGQYDTNTQGINGAGPSFVGSGFV